ncbi:hypothetical protein PTKIN_Ptkin01aG0080700 [Pterospermum kingtungense]
MGTISNRLIIICWMYQITIATHFWPGMICSAQNVTAVFVFGDSLVEAGNNYYIGALAKPGFPNGFENADSACCRVIGSRGGLIPCGSLSRVCADRTKYVFWDPFHPTESAHLIGAKHILDGGFQYVSPINI